MCCLLSFPLKSVLTLLSALAVGSCPLWPHPLGFLAPWCPSRSSNVRKEHEWRPGAERIPVLVPLVRPSGAGVWTEAAFLGSRSCRHASQPPLPRSQGLFPPLAILGGNGLPTLASSWVSSSHVSPYLCSPLCVLFLTYALFG